MSSQEHKSWSGLEVITKMRHNPVTSRLWEGWKEDAGGFGVYVLNELTYMRLLPQSSKLNQRGFKGRKQLLFPLLLPTTYSAGDLFLTKVAD